jgi:very-short-patch-repair endonuclease
MTRLEFLEKARNIHGYKYKYPSLGEKITLKDKIEIELEECKFIQTVSKHLMGRCPEKNIKKNKEEFIQECRLLWKNKYDYSKIEYKNSLSEITVILDGFEYRQRASSHLHGIAPEFRKLQTHIDLEKEDLVGIEEIEEFLIRYNLNYEKDRRFDYFKFHFYLSDNRTVIEYQGELHFQLENIIKYDDQRSHYCEDNYINLIRIKYDQINIIWELLWDNLKLFINNKKINPVKKE